MKIFVIIITSNGSSWISHVLSSLRNSSVPVIPLIIDNNSSDDTLNIIKSLYPEVILIESKQNLGFGKANNIGIEYALNKGADYFFLLNQDAWVFPDTIKELIDIHKKYPEYFILSPLHLNGTTEKLDHNFMVYLSEGNCQKLVSDSIIPSKTQEEVYSIKFVNAALWLLSKECILKIGGFDPLFRHYGEDNDYANRVNYHGCKVGVCPNALGVHDRNQEPFDWGKMIGRKKYNRKYMAYLEIMKDINRPFSFCFAKYCKNLLDNILTDLAKLKITDLWLEIKVGSLILFKLPKIYQHRSLSKAKGATFLLFTSQKSYLQERSDYKSTYLEA